MWFEWKTINDFNVWHDELCEKLDYPLTSTNQETGLDSPYSQKVESYTLPIEVDGKIIAWVDPENSDRLTTTELRPSSIEISQI
jgi:hypothetical protein